MTFQLLRYGELLKEHPTRMACEIEALERGLVIVWAPDFPGDKPGRSLIDGVEIVEVPHLAEDVRRVLNGEVSE